MRAHPALLSIPLAFLFACDGSSGGDAVDAPRAGDAASDGGTAGDAQGGTDPSFAGPITVTEMTATIPGDGQGRTLPSTIYRPAGAGPHPLVVISPGFRMQRTQYATYARHLATWGFVAITTDYADTSFFPDHDGLADDVPAVIDWALAQASLAIDATKIGVAGHSLGGKISVYAATLDARIKAVVGWDPVDSNSPSVVPQRMASTTAAIAVVGETTNGSGGFMPCAPTADNFQAFYTATTGPALELTVNGADHMDWVDNPNCDVCGLCDPGTADPQLARTVTRRLDVAWMRLHLVGDTTMNAWLDAPPELASNAVAVRRK